MSSTCPICVKAVLNSEEGVACENACQRWFHRECLKMPKAEYQRISGDNRIKWACNRADCIPNSDLPQTLLLNQLTKLTNIITDLSEKVDSLKSLPAKVDNLIAEIDNLNKNFTHLERRVTDNETQMKNLEEKISTASQQQTNPEAVIAEMNDRARRSKNIMLFNLPESSDRGVDTRKRFDLDLVVKLCSKFLPSMNSSSIKVLRVGSKNADKARPLKVILDNETSVMYFLSGFSLESAVALDHCFSGIRVSRDRTPREIDFFRSLKSELDARVSQGEDLTIKYKNNVPCIVKNQKNV